MKINQISLSVAIILFINNCAMPSMISIDSKENIQNIITVKNKSKEEIFIKSMEWFLQTDNFFQIVIDYNDLETGIILGNGNIFWGKKMEISTLLRNIQFSIKIEVKDGRSRMTLSNFSIYFPPDSQSGKVKRDVWVSEYEEVKDKIETIIPLYTDYINATDEIIDDSDW